MVTGAPRFCSRRTVCELSRGADNPRNSEGCFARLRDGSLLFAYSRYRGDVGEDDSPCEIAGLISRDGGLSFEPLPAPLVSAAAHGAENVMSPSLARLPNGELALFYLCKYPPCSAYYMRKALGADETRFGEALCVIPREDGVYYVVNNARVQTLSDGRVLVPAARHRVVRRPDGTPDAAYYAESLLYVGDPDGQGWRRLPRVFRLPRRGRSETGLQEPGVLQLPDGSLYLYFRTDRCFQYESVSFDGGVRWSVPDASRFTSPDSPMLLTRDPFSGRVFAFWNPTPNFNGRLPENGPWISAGRTPFVMAVSADGFRFSSYTVLGEEPDRGYCYPAAFFTDADTLLLSYCCGGPEDGTCLTRTVIERIVLQ